MSKTIKIIFCAGIILSCSAIASVLPPNTVVYFLPSKDTAHVNNLQASVNEETVPGALKSSVSNLESMEQSEPLGIETKVGVSLVDKEKEITVDEAADMVLQPTKVMIIPYDKAGKVKRKKVKIKEEDTVSPVSVHIYPIKNLKKFVKEEPVVKKENKFIVVKEKTKDVNDIPYEEAKWTSWIVKGLENCEGSKANMLNTLVKLFENDKLTDGETVCSMKQKLAKHLQKCHPWPVEYYTPTNNDVKPNNDVQLSVDILGKEIKGKEQACESLDLTHINFEKIDFLKSNFKNEIFANSFFKEATFIDADLAETNFEKAILDKVLFKNVNLENAVLSKASFKFANFDHTISDKNYFNQTNFDNAQFRDVVFSFSDFTDASLQNTYWQDALAIRINLNQAILFDAVFDNVFMDTVFANKTDFSRLKCKKCSFERGKFNYSNFYSAIFNNVNFSWASLQNSDFKGSTFDGKIVFEHANVESADFSEADISKVKDMNLYRIRKIKIDENTKTPDVFPDFEAVSYDEELFKNMFKRRFECSKKFCETIALGRVSQENIAVKAMTYLAYGSDDEKDTMWSVCALGCIADKNKVLDHESIDALTMFVRSKIPFSLKDDLFSYPKGFTPDVDLALRILVDNSIKHDTGYNIDLSGLDLRNFDFSHRDLRNISFEGSNLSGADLSYSLTDFEYRLFNQVVIDEFTKLPKNMKLFMPFKLPDEGMPNWWKPETIDVLKYGDTYWNQIIETKPFLDEYLTAVKQKVKE
ncbi:MAG: pentapeptide repeat-containing protein [Alphaproteobacteria bacterium]|nr:pentapeptide repeat-containing protein [Alphaproteobacteria bacterium]